MLEPAHAHGAGHVAWADLVNLYMKNTFRTRSVWLMASTVLVDMLSLAQVISDAGTPLTGVPRGLVPGGFEVRGSTYWLFGRPIIFTDACPTLGTTGDVCFCDLQSYIVGARQELRVDVSPHLWFDFHILAVKATARLDGSAEVRDDDH